MGLLSELLLLPVAPVRGTGRVLRQVVAEAERQYYDPAVVQRELALRPVRIQWKRESRRHS